ncbi:MAG: M23 family metallopeptidase [Oscillospiraceae bacterium]|jgi:murein DD-endopeptidase MepM/ murein hydrolase activator NlpD|nr:M23 family metallopeptidase [Oscillospiraceae bacterium]
MSKMNFSRGKFSRFISSKGFYVALAICLVGASAATWMAVDRTLGDIENQNNQMLQQDQPFADFPQVEDVEQNVPDVPNPLPDPSVWQPSSSTSSLPSEEPSAQSEQSEPSTEPAESPRLVYALPIRGDVISAYSNGELIRNITLGDWRTHDGMDIYAAKGEDICAAADGTVAEIRNDALWGTVVVLNHADGNQTLYCGLAPTLPVAVGDQVTAREAIGKLDGVPCEISEESHLHFAIRNEGKWLDPMAVLGGSPAA